MGGQSSGPEREGPGGEGPPQGESEAPGLKWSAHICGTGSSAGQCLEHLASSWYSFPPCSLNQSLAPCNSDLELQMPG